MSTIVNYQGFEIEVTSVQLGYPPKKWTVSVMIFRHRDSRKRTTYRPFEASIKYPTKEEAKQASLLFGKQIIDGGIPGSTVNDL